MVFTHDRDSIILISTVKKISTSSVNPSKVVTFFYVGTHMSLMHSRYIFCPASMDVKVALQQPVPGPQFSQLPQ